ncbi:MAG: hypothetical protein FJ276_25910 [Planctomycetes bacterium]|nr:hypothetical protein [Planctomycetota bacterium]
MGFLDWLTSLFSPPPVPPPSIRPQTSSPFTHTVDSRRVVTKIQEGSSPIFVTGKAGTGKSTLLQYIRETTTKKVVVVAPTGIAAVNVRGATIHSFFRFPPRLLTEQSVRINRDRTDMFRQLDTIIIDEVSMVRADLMDAINASLQLHRGNTQPFGGAQLVLFGDLCQLPPRSCGRRTTAVLSNAIPFAVLF